MNKKLALLNPVSLFKFANLLIRNSLPKRDKQPFRSSNTKTNMLRISTIKSALSTTKINWKSKKRSQISKLTKLKTAPNVKATKMEWMKIIKTA